jgi:hypothetical protein
VNGKKDPCTDKLERAEISFSDLQYPLSGLAPDAISLLLIRLEDLRFLHFPNVQVDLGESRPPFSRPRFKSAFPGRRRIKQNSIFSSPSRRS